MISGLARCFRGLGGIDEILTWQHIRSGKHLAFAENIPPWQATDIAQRRLQPVATTGEQKQIEIPIQYTGHITKAAQGDLA